MKCYIGLTDFDWFHFIRKTYHLEEINFWFPSGNRRFSALNPGELFLFKLHHPNNFIVGGGFFAHFSILPVSLAWETFDERNGAANLIDLRQKIEKYRGINQDQFFDYAIGCILLEQPFFLEEYQWIPVPNDWHPNIQQGKTYDLTQQPGITLWNQLQAVLAVPAGIREEQPRYGDPVLVLPRLGQGSFRIMVMDAYKRQCAISMEKTLPALEAAHIKPYSQSGSHEVNNGIFLRKDFHALFEKGYVTITPDMNLEVSRRIREEFENGRDYYQYQGKTINLPGNLKLQPSKQNLLYHNENIFLG